MKYGFNPKNEEIEKVFLRLMKHNATTTLPRLAIDIGRNKKIRFLRKQNSIFIGRDSSKRKSIIFIPPTVKIKRSGKKFFFEY